MIAVSYELPLTARYNGTFQQLYLGVSVLAHPAFNVTERAYAEMKRQMIADFVAPEAKLVVASAWTSEISSTVSTLGAMGPYAGAGAGATVVLGLLGVALKADAQDQVLLDSVDGLDREDQIILARAVALRLKKYPQEGAVFFRSTRSHLSGDNTAQAFFSRLLNLERMGYLRQVPHLAGGHVRYYWQSISL